MIQGMFRWDEPKPSETRESSNASPNPHLDQYRYPNRKQRPVRSSRTRFDTVVLYVVLFVALLNLTWNIVFDLIAVPWVR